MDNNKLKNNERKEKHYKGRNQHNRTALAH